MRIDKWLWVARFFKTRSLALQAIEGGRVELNGDRCKPSKDLRAGDDLRIGVGDTVWRVTVRALSDKRGPASVAQTLYEESAESRAQREELSALRKLSKEPAREIKGRPTKRDRRVLGDWTGK